MVMWTNTECFDLFSCKVIYEGFYNFSKVCLQFFSFLNVAFLFIL